MKIPAADSICLITIVAVSVLAGGRSSADDIRFNRDVRPILSEHCFECHGPDAANREADLRLDLEDIAKDSAILEGNAADSPLMTRVTSADADLVMPPPHVKKPLTAGQIKTLRQWIAEGADYQQHWSFIPLERPPLPRVATGVPQRNGIDSFVFARLYAEGLQPSVEADPLTLIRRVSLDLTGLPPTPEEIEAFLSDDQPGAYERVVDRLLESPHYGEHMALSWLEAARYADTSGYQADWERFMWPWRNWVIDAFNNNMPFDQFTIEQLAGDMLPDATPSQILATGFNRNHRINDEGGVIAAEYAVEYVVDRVDTTSTVWLGLTMGCARCHDHKYDPLPQQDFYGMFALFNNVPEKGKDGRAGYSLPILDYPDPDVASQITQARNQLDSLKARHLEGALARTELRASWEAELRKQVEQPDLTTWFVAEPHAVRASGGVQLERLEDGSYLRGGANPAKTNYTATLPLDSVGGNGEVTAGGSAKLLTGLRLEILRHQSLTNGGLSASSNGNLVLSELTVELLRGGKSTAVVLSDAFADHNQENYPAGNAIDGKPNTGWAAEGHVKREDRTLVFRFQRPLETRDGDELRVQMRHQSKFAQHVIGRFRLSLTSSPSPSLDDSSGLPAEVINALSANSSGSNGASVLNDYFLDTHPAFAEQREDQKSLNDRIAELEKKQFVKVMVMSEMDTPRDTFVLERGQYDQPDKERPASPGIPSVFGRLPGEGRSDRLAFGRWLMSADNPLTARVTVNRFWQGYFGRGLVATVEDFGSQGVPPTHPELLDWLGCVFRDSGWDIKALQKLIVMSHTYRQSSVLQPVHRETDPENKLLARAPRIRLSGYQLRDQALAVSGLLVPDIGGPSVRPYQPPGLWSEVSFQAKNRSTDFYVQDHGDKLYRRGLYTFWKRSVAPPMLANFDAAGREACVVRATRTSTPLQALNLMNDVTFVEAARGMATRMINEGGESVREQIAYGLTLPGLPSRARTVERLTERYDEYVALFRNDETAAKELIANGESAVDESIDAAQLAAMTAVASVILNLDEVVVRQ